MRRLRSQQWSILFARGARLAEDSGAAIRTAYLDRYVLRLDCHYDQYDAVGALLNLDERLGTDRAACFLVPGGVRDFAAFLANIADHFDADRAECEQRVREGSGSSRAAGAACTLASSSELEQHGSKTAVSVEEPPSRKISTRRHGSHSRFRSAPPLVRVGHSGSHLEEPPGRTITN
ncbi:DUF6000 family protein [Streptosporangium roseum]|uniref:DUF6000 family protein n=1 Tax=Streptosporangium roseum TaxID=2001 RepID=UPI003AFAE6A6